jgi:primosomal protein N' (replication factor Y)
VPLVVHGHHAASCNYCGHSSKVPRLCPDCGGPYLEQLGFGTERVEAEVKRAWPAARWKVPHWFSQRALSRLA